MSDEHTAAMAEALRGMSDETLCALALDYLPDDKFQGLIDQGNARMACVQCQKPFDPETYELVEGTVAGLTFRIYRCPCGGELRRVNSYVPPPSRFAAAKP